MGVDLGFYCNLNKGKKNEIIKNHEDNNKELIKIISQL